jgi:ABC-type glycerol-3-phosphate transport system substrate-binding protein|uniref:extracellular solute-binding protein n=1 Tax=Cephaloticoccus sp. TaxID=1985742 RepID=UPI00404A5803
MMNIKSIKRNLALIIALGAYLLAVVLVLTRPGATLSGDDRIVIRLAHWQIEEGPREAMVALVKRYEELNPHIRVEVLAVPGNVYKQWLRTQLIGGNATDIIEFGSFIGGVNDIPPRFFDPISQYMELPNPYNRGTPLEGVRWRDTFLDGLNTLDTYIENLSNYYAVTLCMVNMRLFYNPELLEEISGSPVPPNSYFGMLDLGEKLVQRTAETKQRISLYAGSQFNGIILMEQLLARAGLGLTMFNDRYREQGLISRDAAVEFLRGNWTYRNPELLNGMEQMRQTATNMRPGFQQLERDAAMQEFLRGQAVMIATGTWDATSLIRLAPFKVGVTVLPWPTKQDGEIGRYNWAPVSEGAGGTAMPFYLNKTSPHKKEAMDLLHFMTSVEGNTLFVEQSGWLPSIREVAVPDYAQVYLHRFDGFVARTAYLRGFGGETRELWDRQMYHLTSATGSVPEFLAAFEDKFPDALKRDLRIDLHNMYLSLRRDIPSLTAQATLDRLEYSEIPSAQLWKNRESGQNITEAKIYEAQAVLEKGPAIDASSN